MYIEEKDTLSIHDQKLLMLEDLIEQANGQNVLVAYWYGHDRKRIQLLKERYRDAVEYMEWYQPAWEMLSEDDRFVLETYYGEENVYGSNAIYAIMKHFGVEQTSAYKKKNRALDRFRLLLFGKG